LFRSSDLIAAPGKNSEVKEASLVSLKIRIATPEAGAELSCTWVALASEYAVVSTSSSETLTSVVLRYGKVKEKRTVEPSPV
tara:strand:- start:160 stop:405 length:246 start_codon:yes stop_codon:yes gene_type:complete